MQPNRTKDAAETVLRELPSVLGASVREDINGHPREVHVLVRPVPSARNLARDIRSLLEERLGVPVDQRVISIAELRPDLGHAALANGHRNGAGPTPKAEEPAPGAASRRRLEWGGLESATRQGRVTVQLRLSAAGREYRGEGSEPEAGHGRVRAAAAAAVAAAGAAAATRLQLQREGASVVRAFGREYALVSVLATGDQLGRRRLVLCGAHPVEVDVETAAALASLKAVNRLFEPEAA